MAPFLRPVALVADGCANGRIVGEGMAERAEGCVGGVVGCIRAATGGLLSKICSGALARAGWAGVCVYVLILRPTRYSTCSQ